MSKASFSKRAASLIFSICLVLLFSLTAKVGMAQNSMSNPVISDFLNVYNTAANKIEQLANEIPDSEYDWRPAEGIRSVHEVVLHVTSGNYFFGSMIGVEVPEGINPQTLEQSGMSKEEAVAAFGESVSNIQSALMDMSTDELNEKVDFFGNEVTKRQVVLMLGDHTSEHLGQLIAYARSNGVVPPWSQ